MSQKRSYAQFCSLARALDVIGERWTLLILRDLTMGPRRFKDLLAGLPGIGTNLLAARLDHLTKSGLIAKETLPPPHSTKAYVLQPAGRALEPVLVGLAHWGLDLLEKPRGNDLWRPHWNRLALQARFRPEAAADLDVTLLLEIDGYPHYLTIANGQLTVGEGRPSHIDLSIHCNAETFLAVFETGEQTATEAEVAGKLHISGDRDLLTVCASCFSHPTTVK